MPSSFFYTNEINKKLDDALDCGIKEERFWDMTLSQINREIESFERKTKLRMQNEATNNYVLANLIGISTSRIYNSDINYPAITEVYPNLFDKDKIEDKEDEIKTEQSINNFLKFAKEHNLKMERG